jgi:uncharacterized protein
MKLSVDRLTSSPAPYVYHGDAGWWRKHLPTGHGLPETLAEDFAIDIQAHMMGEDVYLEGRLTGALDLECGRCLARYRHALRESFRLVLEPVGTRVPSDPEAVVALDRDGLCLGDEFEVGWYRGGEIRLDSVCLEVISLALPVKPLCREDCAGLCGQCGADLNAGPCGCDPAVPNSPFAALAALRGGSEGVG